MCGIAAIFAYRDTAPAVSREEVEAITAHMIPRGPDAGGTWFSPDGRVGLGSRRLAIIDLSPGGVQPMHDATSGLTIVFNGEIYNHRELRASLERRGETFRSHSDTEVLLKLYRRDGARMTGLLRGMFAFAIWDARARKLFVARDPYGIKPLYYADDGKSIRLASQVKSLMAGGAISATRDPAGVAGFFLTGSVPEPFTIREAIRAVPAGTSFFVDEGGIKDEQSYFSISTIYRLADSQRGTARLTTPAILLSETLRESVRYHLVSDVPVGVFLSGGIDSSAVAAMIAKLAAEPPRTFTLSFPDFRVSGEDESALAERFAASIGARHTTRPVGGDEFLRLLPKIFDSMDQPTIDGVNTWLASMAVAEGGLKVVLSGVGGDELFGSYPSFGSLRRIVRAGKLSKHAPGLAERMIRLAARAGLTHPKAAAIPRYAADYASAYVLQRGLFLPGELPELLGHDAAEEGLARLRLFERAAAALVPDPHTNHGRAATLESTLYLRNQLLRDSDWASMAHSLELRTPLVDASVLRQIAPLLLERGSRSKDDFAAGLPEWLRQQKKRSFFVPLTEWLDLPADGTPRRMRSWARRVFEAVV